jgi:hypothetical protein
MTELKYRYDPPLVRGLYCVYMAGSIECAFSQHQDCMEIDGCLFHKGASGCRIEYFYSDKCRSEQAATIIRALAESNRDFPEEIFVADPEYEYNSDVWVDLNEEQKDALRKAYAEAREKLYGGKKIMVVDPGHDEGSRTVETLCAVQEGTLVVQDVVDTNDISPNLNEDVILAQNAADYMKDFMELDPKERVRRIHGLPEQEKEYKEKRSGIHADSIEVDGRKRIEDCCTPYESHVLNKKDVRWLKRRYGMKGKARKRLRKKQEQEINLRDRKFRDRAWKSRLVFMGKPDNIRRYLFPIVMSRSKYLVTADIVNKAVPFLDVWNKEV